MLDSAPKTLRRFGLALPALIGCVGVAQAQPHPSDNPGSAYSAPWTGFYGGVAFGTDMMVDQTNLATGGGTSLNIGGLGGQGALGSVYGGVDFQLAPRALIGVLAEVSYGGLDSTISAQVAGGSANLTTHADVSWAALARAGVLASPSTLLYAIGGYTGQNIRTTANALVGGAQANFSQYDTFNGWTLGGGIETKLQGGWSTKFEYRYSQYGGMTLPGTSLTLAPSTHAARIGLTYKFGAPAGDSAQDQPASPDGDRRWTGIYGGGAGGGGAMVNHVYASAGGASAGTDTGGQGLLGSVFAGGDYQFARQALVGIMGDFTWDGLQSVTTATAPGGFATVTSRGNSAWSAMGRLGFLPTPSTLLYAAGGYSNLSLTTSLAGGGATFFTHSDTLNGWTVGPGVEVAIADGWSSRLEYRYSQYQQASFAGATYQPSTQTVRAGLSYKFGMARQ